MASIAKRACIIGAIDVKVSITLHLDARGAIPLEGMEVRLPRGATGLIGHPTPLFQRMTPVLPQKAESVGHGETGSTCEQSFVTTLDAGDLFMVSQETSAVVLATGAAANVVCFSSLARHNRTLERRGVPRVTAYLPQTRFRFGDGRLGEVRHAADIPMGIAGRKGMFTSFVLEADIPPLLRRGAAEALGGQLDFLRDSLNLGRKAAQIPL